MHSESKSIYGTTRIADVSRFNRTRRALAFVETAIPCVCARYMSSCVKPSLLPLRDSANYVLLVFWKFGTNCNKYYSDRG